MKKLITIIAILLSFSNIYAQLFDGGIDFGLSASQIDGDGRGGYHRLGPVFNVYATININSEWKINSGIGYVMKGAYTGSKYEYFATNLNYAEIPLLVEYKPFNNVSFSAGFAYAYLFKGIQKTTFTIFDENDLNLLNNEMSLLVSFNYFFNDKMTLRLSTNYSLFPITNYQGSILTTNLIVYYLFYYGATSQLWWNNSIRLTLRFNLFSEDKKNNS
ncbi:MAG: outer membrane beta-barrel protein [Bacteroidota bacterium]|nr:outer membrane beta-barrel protein [Bacteroidota bacterium]